MRFPIGDFHLMTPAWIRLNGQNYELVPERAEAIRTMFRLATEGLGAERISRELQQHHKPFTRSGTWHTEYIRHTLQNRAVLGEYQPGVRNEKGRRVLAGNPIQNFYPAVVSPRDFYLAQRSIASRRHKSGRPGSDETNLFTGMVYQWVDQSPMCVTSIPARPPYEARHYLTSVRVRNEALPKRQRNFPYTPFERAILACIENMKLSDLEASPKSTERERLQEELEACGERLKEIERHAAAAPPNQLGRYLTLLDTVAEEQKKLQRQLEQENAAEPTQKGMRETKSLVEELAELPAGKRGLIRRRLKGRIQSLIESIWVHIEEINSQTKRLHARAYFRHGESVYCQAATWHYLCKNHIWAPGPSYYDVDFRDPATWPTTK